MNITKTAIAVAVATTDEIASIEVADFTSLSLQVTNTGAGALDAFEVWAKFASGGLPVKVLGLSTDYTTPVFPAKSGSQDLTTVPATTGARHAFLDVSGFHTIILKASAATNPTTVALFGQAN